MSTLSYPQIVHGMNLQTTIQTPHHQQQQADAVIHSRPDFYNDIKMNLVNCQQNNDDTRSLRNTNDAISDLGNYKENVLT